MQNLTVQEKNKLEVDKIFDVTESTLLEYLSNYYKKTPKELFKIIPKKNNDSLILKPLGVGEVGDKYIKLNLSIVNKEYKTELIDELKKNEHIMQSIGFLYHGVNTVLNMTNQHNINENIHEYILKHSIHFELDVENLTFYPVYVNPMHKAECILLQYKFEIEKLLNQGKCGDDDDDTIENLTNQLNSINYDLENNINYNAEEVKKEEEEKNKLIKETSIRIGIIVSYINFDQTPEQYQKFVNNEYEITSDTYSDKLDPLSLEDLQNDNL